MAALWLMRIAAARSDPVPSTIGGSVGTALLLLANRA